MRSSVVLPLPLWPSSTTRSTGVDGEVQRPDGRRVAVGLGQLDGLERGPVTSPAARRRGTPATAVRHSSRRRTHHTRAMRTSASPAIDADGGAGGRQLAHGQHGHRRERADGDRPDQPDRRGEPGELRRHGGRRRHRRCQRVGGVTQDADGRAADTEPGDRDGEQRARPPTPRAPQRRRPRRRGARRARARRPARRCDARAATRDRAAHRRPDPGGRSPATSGSSASRPSR